MNRKRFKLIPETKQKDGNASDRLSYWRSAHDCFSIHYKGIITEICKGDLGYGDMDRLDGAIHAAIGCKQKKGQGCTIKKN